MEIRNSEQTAGGWKLNTVLIFIFFHDTVASFCLFYQDETRKTASVKTYYCQLTYHCKCQCRMELVCTVAEIQTKHDIDSHKKFYGKHVTPFQKQFLITATKSNQLELPSAICRGTSRRTICRLKSASRLSIGPGRYFHLFINLFLGVQFFLRYE